MDMLAFTGTGKTVILLTNMTDKARNMTIKGLPGNKLSEFRTSDSEDMISVGEKAITKGESTVYLPSHSVLLLETNGGM